jgi:hypothetical protein
MCVGTETFVPHLRHLTLLPTRELLARVARPQRHTNQMAPTVFFLAEGNGVG